MRLEEAQGRGGGGGRGFPAWWQHGEGLGVRVQPRRDLVRTCVLARLGGVVWVVRGWSVVSACIE
jgi:hypothetical protein